MALTPEQMVRAFARKYPTPASHPNGGDNDWDQDCGTAMSRLCLEYGSEPTGNVSSAYRVYLRSTIVSTDWTRATPGDFHFWDIAGPANGHVSFEVFGGGRNTFMANHRVTSIEGAVNLGFLSVPDYTRLSGATYKGFSRQYADGDVRGFVLPQSATAVTTTHPLTSEGDDMGFYVTTSSQAPKYWYSQATGKLRKIGIPEWDFLRAQERQAGSINGGVKLEVVTISEEFLKALGA